MYTYTGVDGETAKVQEIIHDYQNPQDCSTGTHQYRTLSTHLLTYGPFPPRPAKYMVWPMSDEEGGMGAELHTLSWALTSAMIAGRVLVYDPDR